jgi:hypothetical protein
MTEICLAINIHMKNRPQKKRPLMWLQVTEFWTFPRQHILVTTKLKQNYHNHFYINFTQFRIMKNVLLSVHTWHTIFCVPTKVKNFVNLIWHVIIPLQYNRNLDFWWSCKNDSGILATNSRIWNWLIERTLFSFTVLKNGRGARLCSEFEMTVNSL